MRVLIVDDEPDILMALRLSWMDEDVDLATATSGRAALEALDPPPDVVLTDFKMPGMDGVELAARIRDVLPDVPIALMTAFPDVHAGDGVISEIIAKPFDTGAVLERVKALVA